MLSKGLQSVIPPSDPDRVDSWKLIALYLNRTVRTVQRWEKQEGLPVHRRSQGADSKSSVHAYKSELDQWFLRGSAEFAAAVPESALDNEPVAPEHGTKSDSALGSRSSQSKLRTRGRRSQYFEGVVTWVSAVRGFFISTG
jgi:hypothetical protein